MDTLIVTGGAGFIGGNFVRRLVAGGRVRVVTVDKLTYAGNRATLAGLAADRHTFVDGDICDRALVAALLKRHRPRALVNFAAESHVDRSIDAPADFIETNIVGVYALLETARAAELDPDFVFVHVSTDEVFGDLAAGAPPFTETTPYAPSSPYSASKAAADHLVRAWGRTYGLPVIVTNASNNYGPYQYPEKLVPLIVLNGLEGKPLPVYGDGAQRRDWLFVDDHCAALERVLEKGRAGETYLIGAGQERSNRDVVAAVCRVLDSLRPDAAPHARLIRSVADRPGHDRRYAVDAAKARRELDWRPRRDLETGLGETVRWYLDNAAWWRPLRARYAGARLGLAGAG